jgi:hypothetical protein
LLKILFIVSFESVGPDFEFCFERHSVPDASEMNEEEGKERLRRMEGEEQERNGDLEMAVLSGDVDDGLSASCRHAEWWLPSVVAIDCH